MIIINDNFIRTYQFADYLKCEMDKAIGEVARAIDMMRLCTTLPIDIHFNDIPDVIGRMRPVPGSEHIFEELSKNILQKMEIAMSVSRKIKTLEDIYNGKDISDEYDVQKYETKGETSVNTDTGNDNIEVAPELLTTWDTTTDLPAFEYVDFNDEVPTEDEIPTSETAEPETTTEPETTDEPEAPNPTPTTVQSKPENKTRIKIPEGWADIQIPNWRPGQFMASPNGFAVDRCRNKPVHHYHKSSRGVEVYCFYDNYCRHRVFEIPMTDVMTLAVKDDNNVVTTVVEKTTLPTSIVERPTTTPTAEPVKSEPVEIKTSNDSDNEYRWLDWIGWVPKRKYKIFRDGRLYNTVEDRFEKLIVYTNYKSTKPAYYISAGDKYSRTEGVTSRSTHMTAVVLVWKAFHPEDRDANIQTVMVDGNFKNVRLDNIRLKSRIDQNDNVEEAEIVDTTAAVVINWVEGVDKNRYYIFKDGRLYDTLRRKWCNEYKVATGNQYRLCRKSDKVKDIRIVTLLYKAFHPEARSIKHLTVKNNSQNGEIHIDNLTL